MTAVTVEGKGGRPRLGDKKDPLIYRNVGLLASHWRWLRAQRGGASAAFRKLVEKAMKRGKR